MSRLLYQTCVVLGISLLAPVQVRADGILDHVPQDAIGFLSIRNLSATNAKIEKVEQIFQEISPQPLPAPLPLLKAATGLGPGINEEGDALLAVLPLAENPASDPIPLFLVAVSDYAAFANSVSGDATGEICRVTIAGQDVLAAKRGSYVVLMNVEHRDRLEELLSSDAKPVDGLAPLAAWLAKVDVAAVLTPSGVDLLTAQMQAELAKQREEVERVAEPQFAEVLAQAQQALALYENLLGFVGAKIDAAAVGIAIDDAVNVRLVSQIVLTKDGEAAQLAPLEPLAESPLAGFADEPFVVAGGGPIPPSYADAMSKLLRNLIEAVPGAYGFEDFDQGKWKELEDSWRDSMQGLKSASMVMLVGEGDEPLYSNIYALFGVDDSQKYLEAYQAAMSKWNELLGDTSSDIKLQYESSEVEIDGKKGVLTTSDVASAAGDENVPMWGSMVKAMFGEDGLMKAYLIPVNESTLVLGISDEEGVAQAINHAEAQEMGLAKSELVQATANLLDARAPWQIVISPKGSVAWFQRVMTNLFAPMGGGVPTLPEYPESPPIGVSMKLADGKFSSELVWPAETVQGLAKYIKAVGDAF